MAFSLTNKTLHINTPGALVPNIGSTAYHQILGTATTTSTSIPPTSRWEYGDYTSTQAWIPATTQVRTGGVGDFGYPHKQYRALVYFKSLTADASATSTIVLVGPTITLECATSTAGFVGTGSTGSTLNSYIIDSKVMVQSTSTSTGQTQTYYLFGTTPLVAGAQFARVGFYPPTNGNTTVSSTALDVIIEGIG